MMNLRAQFAGYTFEERETQKNPNKQTYGKLTYEAIKDFIKGKETEERAKIILKELNTVIDLSKAQKASYTYVKKWFLNLHKRADPHNSRKLLTVEDAAYILEEASDGIRGLIEENQALFTLDGWKEPYLTRRKKT